MDLYNLFTYHSGYNQCTKYQQDIPKIGVVIGNFFPQQAESPKDGAKNPKKAKGKALMGGFSAAALSQGGDCQVIPPKSPSNAMSSFP